MTFLIYEELFFPLNQDQVVNDGLALSHGQQNWIIESTIYLQKITLIHHKEWWNKEEIFQTRSIVLQSDKLKCWMSAEERDWMNPTTQNMTVKTREAIGSIRLPISFVKVGLILVLVFPSSSCFSSSPLLADLTSIKSTLEPRATWDALGRFDTSLVVWSTTSRKGMVIVKSIQMSIILMDEVTGRLWERPRNLRRH